MSKQSVAAVDDTEYEIEEVLKRRTVTLTNYDGVKRVKKRVPQVLVRWKGFDPKSDLWIDESTIKIKPTLAHDKAVKTNAKKSVKSKAAAVSRSNKKTKKIKAAISLTRSSSPKNLQLELPEQAICKIQPSPAVIPEVSVIKAILKKPDEIKPKNTKHVRFNLRDYIEPQATKCLPIQFFLSNKPFKASTISPEIPMKTKSTKSCKFLPISTKEIEEAKGGKQSTKAKVIKTFHHKGIVKVKIQKHSGRVVELTMQHAWLHYPEVMNRHAKKCGL